MGYRQIALSAVSCCVVGMVSLSAMGADEQGWRGVATGVLEGPVKRLHVTTLGEIIEEVVVGGTQRGCPQQVSTHTDADFAGGAFVIQQGFAETEIAASSFTVAAADFPLRIDLMEMVFAQQTNIQTTTHWSVLIWEGTPNMGNLVATFSSDDVILPHLVLPAGTSGANIAVSVDPNDPNQIILNDNGSQTFTVGYRIDKHNNQTQNPCVVPPPANQNAFPTTDTSGVLSPSENWIFAVSGPFCVITGWNRFSQLGAFSPSGDWVLRVSWTPLNCNLPTGACCLSDGSCLDGLTQTECESVLSGTWQGAASTCATTNCPEPTGACCFGTGTCIDLTQSQCGVAGGTYLGDGTQCNGNQCPTGACCLPDGTCIDGVTDVECMVQGGVFQGVGTDCATTNCPAPVGACCFAGGCLELTEADCALAAGTWAGAGTDCVDGDGNGVADACENPCPVDFNGDGIVDVLDFFAFVVAFNIQDPQADLNGDTVVDVLDFFLFVGLFSAGC